LCLDSGVLFHIVISGVIVMQATFDNKLFEFSELLVNNYFGISIAKIKDKGS
jgi:hypothetical protein